MTSSIEFRVKQALSEVEEFCSVETLDTLVDYIQSLEEEVDTLSIELDSIDSRQKRRRRDDDDWN